MTGRGRLEYPASLVLMLVCGLAQAGDWEDGYAAYERQDYKTAVKLWRKVADTGDSSGQSILGAMYAQGQGVPQDYVESIKWYRLAAAQGEPKAQSKLGFMYANALDFTRFSRQISTSSSKLLEYHRAQLV
jgi:TPR repeat protein